MSFNTVHRRVKLRAIYRIIWKMDMLGNIKPELRTLMIQTLSDFNFEYNAMI